MVETHTFNFNVWKSNNLLFDHYDDNLLIKYNIWKTLMEIDTETKIHICSWLDSHLDIYIYIYTMIDMNCESKSPEYLIHDLSPSSSWEGTTRQGPREQNSATLSQFYCTMLPHTCRNSNSLSSYSPMISFSVSLCVATTPTS